MVDCGDPGPENWLWYVRLDCVDQRCLLVVESGMLTAVCFRMVAIDEGVWYETDDRGVLLPDAGGVK